MLRGSGASSTPQPIDSITSASEYWIARSSRAMTVERLARMLAMTVGGGGAYAAGFTACANSQ